MFTALAFDGPLSREEVHKVNRALLARETGWTYHYIDDELDFTEVTETLAIYDAVDRARAWVQQRAQRGPGKPTGRRR